MTIPGFQKFMLPVLQVIADGREYPRKEIRQTLISKMELEESEIKKLIPSGRTTIFANRSGWAITYLKKAGLLESSRRGYIKITDRGKEFLTKGMQDISIRDLKQYPEFVEFISPKKDGEEERESTLFEEQTPQELIENGYRKIREDLSLELLQAVKETSSSFFERLVVDLIIQMGYGGSHEAAGEAIGKSGDEGIDGIIKEDRLGLDVIYLQAKKWEGSVGRPEIQKFVGALQGKRAKKGIFITTGEFSKDAREYVDQIEPKIVLIDGKQLAELMIDYDLGVFRRMNYEIKEIDSDYFTED